MFYYVITKKTNKVDKMKNIITIFAALLIIAPYIILA